MKLKLLFIAIISAATTQAQLIVSPNPFGVNSGDLTITYGSAGNYSLFDPMSDPNLLLYTGLETDGNAATWDYHDNFANAASLVQLTYSSFLGFYIADVNIGTRTYQQEPALNNTTIPNGLTINNWYFLIRNVAGTRQSADLQGSNFGFASGTFLSRQKELFADDFYIAQNKIFNNLNGNSNVEIYNQLGQKVQSFNLSQNENKEINFLTKGIFVAVINNNNKKRSIKFIN